MRDGWTRTSDSGVETSWPATRLVPRTPSFSPAAEGIWRPEAGAGPLVGGALLVLAALACLIALRSAIASPGAGRLLWGLLFLATLSAATWFGMLLLQLRSLHYILGPDALIVTRRGLRIDIPYREIEAVVLRPRDRIDVAGYERYWPGYYDASVATSEGPWRSLATTPANRRVRVHARNRPTLAISPERPVLFVEALETRRQMAGRARTARAEPPWPAEPPRPSGVPEFAPSPAPVPEEQHAPAPSVAEARRQRLPDAQRPDWLAAPEAWRVFRERIVRGDPVGSNLLALSLIALILLVTLTVWRADAVSSPVAVRWNVAGEPVEHVRPGGFWIFEGVWIYPATASAVIVVNAALATFAAYLERLREARMLLATAIPVELVLMAALWRATR